MKSNLEYLTRLDALARTPAFLSVLLMVLASLAYVNSFPATFLLDDTSIVVENPLVSYIDLNAIFTTDYWGHAVNSGLFRPLTILSFSLGHYLGGGDATWVHAVNLALHAMVCLVMFWALQSLGVCRSTAWLAAALFAVHPIHTEVVNEAVGRAELLAALWVLVAVWAWGMPRKALGVSLLIVAYLLAILSKENSIILLGWLPIIEFFRGRFDNGRWRQRLVPYLLLCLMTMGWLGWRAWGVIRPFSTNEHDPIYTPLVYLPDMQRVLTALNYQWLYLRKLIFPVDLQGIYSGSTFFQPTSGILTLEGGLVVCATLLFVSGVVRLFWKRNYVGLGLLLYMVAIVPVSNLVFVSGVTFAERLVYLPSVGFCLALAAMLVWMETAIPWRSRTFLCAVPLLLLLVMTLLRNPDYRSAQSLWKQDVNRDPQNVLAVMYLANAYAAMGEAQKADQTYLLMKSNAPGFAEGLRNYAAFLLEEKRYDEAIKTALEVALNPGGISPTNCLVLGQAFVAVGDYQNAFYWLEKTPLSYKAFGIYWEYHGRALEGLGDIAGAIESYRKIVDYPEKSKIPLRLGLLLLQTGQVHEARKAFAKAVQLNPDSAAEWNSFGISLVMAKDLERAAGAFQKAVQLAPDETKYRENLERLKRDFPDKY